MLSANIADGGGRFGVCDAGEAMVASPVIGIVILNWNNWEETISCVESVKASNYLHARLYVVDNASSDGSEARLRTYDPSLRVIQSGANRGWAGGNNVGVRAALDDGCEHVLLLNADAALLPDTIACLVEAIPSGSDAAAFGTLVQSAAEPNWLEFAGSYIDSRTGHPAQVSILREEATFASPVQATLAVKGCSFLMTGEGLRRIGLLKEDYFLNYDETDWCFEARSAGMKIYLVSSATVIHQGATSMGGTTTPIYRYFTTRNRLLFAHRHLDTHGRRFAWRCALWELKDGLLLEKAQGFSSLRHRLLVVASVLLAIRDYCLGRFGDCPRSVRTMTSKYKTKSA